MRVDVSTVLECSADQAWGEVQTSALLLHVIWPWARITPVGGDFPERWPEGKEIKCRSYLFGLIPMGVRTLLLERIDPVRRQIQSREHDPLIRRWDHLIAIEPRGEAQAFYRDTIEIDAGIFTLVVWAWANGFYRHRQRRWRALAKRLAACRRS